MLGTAFAAHGGSLAVHSDSGTIQPANAVLSSLGYSGEFFDASAQQQYLRARFYNPANGRFNRLDPFAGNMQDPQSLHKYAYVHGDPIQGIDPSGLQFSAKTAFASMNIAAGMSARTFVAGVALVGATAYAAYVGLLDYVLDLIFEALRDIRTGVLDGLGSITATSATALALDETLNHVAQVTAFSKEQLRRMKIMFVREARYNEVYEFKRDYLKQWPIFVLRYLGPESDPIAKTLAEENRAWVRSVYRQTPKPPGEDLDEYPYASTSLGGFPLAVGTYLSASQNRSEGADLRWFYERQLNHRRSRFLVVPIPKNFPKELPF